MSLATGRPSGSMTETLRPTASGSSDTPEKSAGLIASERESMEPSSKGRSPTKAEIRYDPSVEIRTFMSPQERTVSRTETPVRTAPARILISPTV